jgi:LysR family transcriptional regulator, nod-box dependent transcriptional activator
MRSINLRRHNLNALPVLRDILRHGNLTRAAASLGLTQPALSNVLRQLRMDFDDPLIVRNGKVMQLTPKAEALLGPLEASLATIEALLSDGTFHPETCTKRFRIATTDHIITMLAPSFLTLLLDEAPLVRTQMSVAQANSPQALMVGDLEMVISPKVLLTAGIADTSALDSVNTELLLCENLVCLAKKEDEEFTAGLSLDAYLARPHAGYYFGDKLVASIEQVHLARLGLKQNDRLLVSNYAALPGAVAASGCLALVPESMARSAALLFPLQFAPPPFQTESIDWTMVWHIRNDRDPTMIWLRESLKRSVASLDASLNGKEQAATRTGLHQ